MEMTAREVLKGDISLTLQQKQDLRKFGVCTISTPSRRIDMSDTRVFQHGKPCGGIPNHVKIIKGE